MNQRIAYVGKEYFQFQMSSSLRERLKRAGRCYKSPATTKRLCRTSVESQERAEPCQSGSSSPVCREKSIIDETVPDVTMTKTSAVVKDVAGCSDGELMTPDTTGYLYPSNDKSVNLCQTPTSKRCPKSTGDAVSPCLYVTPCKANDASAAKDINITPRRESVNEEGHDTYNTPCRVKHDLDIGVSSHSSTPVRPTDQTAADMTVQSLKIQKTATLERIAKAEETLRKLKMVKMYRTKVGAEIFVWGCFGCFLGPTCISLR